MRVETFFQMDYRTGEWKRLRKTRALRPEEMSTFQQMFIQSAHTPAAS
ncbi:unnamed protein product [Brugia pahangi]|uniref:Transposase n=1 Tax=Brugia pahangi TaxID=6280 RepID=A0A0N4TC59_BRUPA|nr:unnamed protein product [Brugia pahangi]